jgi:hypothetical protein
MKTYDVTAMSIDPRTGEAKSAPRSERVSSANSVFAGVTGPWDVEDRYHAFWNRLNDSWESSFPSYKDKVVVLSVKEVS